MLDASDRPFDALPPRPGVGYKPQHFQAILDAPGAVDWLEIHAENYMGDGGRPLAQLRHLAERFPISVHGVGLSIGGEGPLDADHLARLKHLVGWLNPASFSEHLAWSTHDSALPERPAAAALYRQRPWPASPTISTRCRTRSAAGCCWKTPRPTSPSPRPRWTKIDFLTGIARRTGCGLLLDVNNVFVSATNQQTAPRGIYRRLPASSGRRDPSRRP